MKKLEDLLYKFSYAKLLFLTIKSNPFHKNRLIYLFIFILLLFIYLFILFVHIFDFFSSLLVTILVPTILKRLNLLYI